MDNITHTLVSVLAGETAHRFAPGRGDGLRAQSRRNAGIALMVIGNNLPDADFIYSTVTGSKLDYLLQHRGHTHTLLVAVLIGLAMLAATALWHRWQGSRWSRSDLLYLAGLSLFAPLLHIGLDFTNSYGVHPFWPFDNRWHYGDAVFIIEPLLWACATPLLFAWRSKWARVPVALVLLAAIGLSIVTGMVPPSLVAMLILVMLALAAVGRVSSERTALASGVLAWIGITVMFFATGRAAESRIAAMIASENPAAQTLDLVLTPLPANPICREVYVVQIIGDDYVVRKAAHSLAPEWFPASDCPLRAAGEEATAAWRPPAASSSAQMHWLGEITLPAGLLGELSGQFCSVRALLHFARVPWAQPRGTGWIVGDLRYDREPESGFGEIESARGADECPRFIPGWIPPRSDLPGVG